MSSEESRPEVQNVHQNTARIFTKERDEAREEAQALRERNLSLQGCLDKVEQRADMLKSKMQEMREQYLSLQGALDEADAVNLASEQVEERRRRVEAPLAYDGSLIASFERDPHQEEEIENMKAKVEVYYEKNLGTSQSNHNLEVQLQGFQNKVPELKANKEADSEHSFGASAYSQRLEAQIQALMKENAELKAQREEAKDLESVAYIQEAQVQDLKSQLSLSNDQLSRYITLMGWLLCQELGHTEELKVWVGLLRNQCKYYDDVALKLSTQSAQLIEKTAVFDQQQGHTEELESWMQPLHVHIDYCLQVANRLRSQRSELRDITQQMAIYSQRSKREEAQQKMQAMNLKGDLETAGYWPLKPSYITTEANLVACSTSFEKGIEKPVRESLPSPSHSTGQIAVKVDKSQPSKPPKNIKKALEKVENTQLLSSGSSRDTAIGRGQGRGRGSRSGSQLTVGTDHSTADSGNHRGSAGIRGAVRGTQSRTFQIPLVEKRTALDNGFALEESDWQKAHLELPVNLQGPRNVEPEKSQPPKSVQAKETVSIHSSPSLGSEPNSKKAGRAVEQAAPRDLASASTSQIRESKSAKLNLPPSKGLASDTPKAPKYLTTSSKATRLPPTESPKTLAQVVVAPEEEKYSPLIRKRLAQLKNSAPKASDISQKEAGPPESLQERELISKTTLPQVGGAAPIEPTVPANGREEELSLKGKGPPKWAAPATDDSPSSAAEEEAQMSEDEEASHLPASSASPANVAPAPELTAPEETERYSEAYKTKEDRDDYMRLIQTLKASRQRPRPNSRHNALQSAQMEEKKKIVEPTRPPLPGVDGGSVQ